MRYRLLSITICIFSIYLFGCNGLSGNGGKIKIENKLNKNTVCILGYNYPDLSFKFTSKQAIMANINRFEIDANQNKVIDTLGLCNKEIWDDRIKHSLVMLFVFDKDKLATVDKLEDALLERYYFSYQQLQKTNGVITLSN